MKRGEKFEPKITKVVKRCWQQGRSALRLEAGEAKSVGKRAG